MSHSCQSSVGFPKKIKFKKKNCFWTALNWEKPPFKQQKEGKEFPWESRSRDYPDLNWGFSWGHPPALPHRGHPGVVAAHLELRLGRAGDHHHAHLGVRRLRRRDLQRDGHGATAPPRLPGGFSREKRS